MRNTFVEASTKMRASAFFTRIHCTYKYRQSHATQKRHLTAVFIIL
jgi:hypothetical protein